MDKLIHYRESIRRSICKYAGIKASHGTVESETIFNDDEGHYELIEVGWDGWKRIHRCVIHIDMRDGKVWIQHDGIEHGIANDLVEAGIPREDIVLAFHPPSQRQFTGFAVA